MIVNLINCKDKITGLGVDIDSLGGWDNLRAMVTNKLPNISCSYDCVDGVLSIEVEDGSVIPDMSEFGEVQPSDSTQNGL